MSNNQTKQQLLIELARLTRQNKILTQALQDHVDGKECWQCLVARLGEGTLECSCNKLCLSCQLGNKILQLSEKTL